VDEAVARLGENVRLARHERGWTQEDLAHLSGLAVVQISRIERGRREVRLTTLIGLIVAFETTPDQLLNGLY
jgi:transcriptional regulator with XRE-family HTH domain